MSDSEIKLPLILWNIPHAKCIHEMQAAAGFFYIQTGEI